MESSLKVINSPASGCGSCSTTGCGTCAPARRSGERDLIKPPATRARRPGRLRWSDSGRLLQPGTKNGEKSASPPGPAAAPPASNVSPELDVVQKGKGTIITVLDEFYKMGPGPSSSHTMGPMRITYDFFQRVSKLPEDQLKRATALKVHLFGSLSATGKGHGTDRASLAGLLGKAPATCPPEFLDGLAANPDEAHKVTIGPTSLNLTLKDIVFDAPKGTFPHPNTMTAKLLAGNETLYELEYYSVGGGFIEWKGYKPPDKGKPKYPFSQAKHLKKFIIDDKIPLPQLLLENEMAISGKSEKADLGIPRPGGRSHGARRGHRAQSGECSPRPDQIAQQGGRNSSQPESLQRRRSARVPLARWQPMRSPWARKTPAAISS